MILMLKERRRMKDLCLETYTEKIAPMVFAENIRQLDTWGVQDRDPFEWLAFATEELGEMAAIIVDWHFHGSYPEEVVEEAIQTATLCLKIAEMFHNLKGDNAL